MENDINKYVAEQIKKFRSNKNMTQLELAEALNTTQQTIARYESGERKANQDILYRLAEIFNTSIDNFFPPIKYNNCFPVKINNEIVKIPLYGTIKAGIPMDAQEDIIDYVEIPKSWIKNNKSFYALKISGDSMSPKYNNNDIVVFENVDYYQEGNNKDCAVMVDGIECTFKKVFINENGITLQPYNSSDYQPSMFSNEQAKELPIRVVGIAVRRITDILN